MIRTPKYRSKKTVVDGITFDSKAEAARYAELKYLQTKGVIKNLRLQVPFELAPGVLLRGAKRKSPALRFFADFVYIDCASGMEIIEDVKSNPTMTTAYKIKRHLMKAVLGLDITETGRNGKKVYG